MLYYLGFFLITSLGLFIQVKCLFVEDLDELFKDQHCIEASLSSMTLKQKEVIMLDSNSINEATMLSNTSTSTSTFEKNPLTKINEVAQHNGISIDYELIKEEGPSHSKQFTVKLLLGDEFYEGTGVSLKKAKMEAARFALKDTFFDMPPEKINEKDKPPPTVILNNVATKLGISVNYYLLNEKEQKIESYGALDQPYGKSKDYHDMINATNNPLKVPVEDSQKSGPFFVKVEVGKFTFRGMGHSVQAARHDAAHNALMEIEKKALLKDNICTENESSAECKKKKEGLKSAVSRVHEASQKLKKVLDFILISETGEAHKKMFVMQCKFGDLVTEAEATSKKECKQLAAEKMLQLLPEMFYDYNESNIVAGLSDKSKKRKKKKKSLLQKDTNILGAVSEMASTLWSSDDETSSSVSSGIPKKNSPKKGSPSAKGKILEIGSKLNIGVEFTDLPKQDDLFCSVMTLNVKPSHLCLGKAASRDNAHEAAALHGLKFLHTSGIFEKPELTEYKNINFADYINFEETIGEDLQFDTVKEKKK